MQVFLKLILILSLISFSSCKKRNVSRLHNSGISKHGVMKDYKEVQEGLIELSKITNQWLTNRCTDYFTREGCVELSWDRNDLSEEEKKRLWLAQLNEARDRADFESSTIQVAIYIDGIEEDMEALNKQLEPQIEEINSQFFKKYIGQDKDPFDQQLEYMTSLKYIEFLSSLQPHAADTEIESQFTLLKAIRKDSFSNQGLSDKIKREILLKIALYEAKHKTEDFKDSIATIFQNNEEITAKYADLLTKVYDSNLGLELNENNLEAAMLKETGHNWIKTFLNAIHRTGITAFLLEQKGGIIGVTLIAGVLALASGTIDFQMPKDTIAFSLGVVATLNYFKSASETVYNLVLTQAQKAQSVLKFFKVAKILGTITAFLAVVNAIYSGIVDWNDNPSWKKITDIVEAGVLLAAGALGVYISFFAAASTVPVLNILAAAIGVVAIILYVVTEAFNKPLENAVDENSPQVQFYKNGINPNKSYWVWCSHEAEKQKNCMQSFTATELVQITNQNDRVVRGGQYGGPGGRHTLNHHTGRASYYRADENIAHDNIAQINIYTCNRGDKVGLNYNYRNDRSKFYHIGCGSRSKDRENISTMNLGDHENLTSLEVFHAQIGDKSRRLYKLKLCTDSERCIETKNEFGKGDEYYKSSIFLEGRAKYLVTTSGISRIENAKGPIVGFYGKYGDSIDSIGIYLRVKPEITYNRRLLDDSIEWYHMRHSGYCFQRAKIELKEQISQEMVKAIQGEAGRCNCDYYYNVIENDPLYGITATCNEK